MSQLLPGIPDFVDKLHKAAVRLQKERTTSPPSSHSDNISILPTNNDLFSDKNIFDNTNATKDSRLRQEGDLLLSNKENLGASYYNKLANGFFPKKNDNNINNNNNNDSNINNTNNNANNNTNNNNGNLNDNSNTHINTKPASNKSKSNLSRHNFTESSSLPL